MMTSCRVTTSCINDENDSPQEECRSCGGVWWVKNGTPPVMKPSFFCHFANKHSEHSFQCEETAIVVSVFWQAGGGGVGGVIVA
jgi:hypothetical protein